VNRIVLVVALASCIDVAPEFTCATDAECGGAGRCEASGNCSFPDATCGSAGNRYDASAGARAGVCVLADQVSQIAVDFAQVSGPALNACGVSGSRDISFELTIAAAQTIVVDSPGVTTTVAIYTGTCPPSASSDAMCSDSPCNGDTYGRTAQILGAGTYCIVAEQTGTATSGMVRVFPINGPAILPTGSNASERTCSHPVNTAGPSCFTPVGPSIPMLVWKCPGSQLQLDATVMPEADLDMGMSLRDATDDSEVAGGCVHSGGNGSNETIDTTIASPGPYWLMLDGAGGGATQCGNFTIDYTLQ
jgi:hypothetical protein